MIDISNFNQFPWEKLEHAYGSAGNVPKNLKALLSDNDDELNEAICGFLHSEACHQYTTYSCTPFVVRCVLHILAQKEFEPDSLKGILGFILACTYSAKTSEVLKDEIIAGSLMYGKFASHDDLSIQIVAKKLVDFCLEYKA